MKKAVMALMIPPLLVCAVGLFGWFITAVPEGVALALIVVTMWLSISRVVWVLFLNE